MSEHSIAYYEKEYPKLLAQLAENRRTIKSLKSQLIQSRSYIEVLELRCLGEAVSFAGPTPTMHTVPAGWLMGLREENAALRARLGEGVAS